jgi:hypothetical protein
MTPSGSEIIRFGRSVRRDYELQYGARLVSAARAASTSAHPEDPQMDNLIARVATAANLPPEVARKAVALMADFLQREASEDAVKDLFEKAPALQAIVASGSTTGGEGMGFGLKGLMGIAAGAMGGGGGGLMALGGELMGLGLNMDQIQTVGREVFGYVREVAGDETVGEITASIPGLSQFI